MLVDLRLNADKTAEASQSVRLLSGSVRVGLVPDFAEPLLSGVLADFAHAHPEVRLDVEVGGSAALRRSLADGRLDVVLCIALPKEEPVAAAPMCWLGDPELAACDPVPLVLLDAPCVFRDAALLALKAAGRRWRLAVSTPSVSELKTAVAAGLGLTVRTANLGKLGEVPDGAMPPVGRVRYGLITSGEAGAAARHLAKRVAERVSKPVNI